MLLSFLWPGLGQLYVGRRRSGLIFATPAVILLLLVVWEARDGADILAARLLLVPASSLLLVIATIFLAIWRLVSMTAALADPRAALPRRTRTRLASASWSREPRRTAVTFAVLAAIVLGTHGLVAWTGLAFLQGFSRVYVGTEPHSTPGPGATPGDFGVLPTPYSTPQPGGRINVLLIGADSGLGYAHALTDTLILVTVDPQGRTVDMLSLPRDIAEFPLFSGGKFKGKINALSTYANAHPSQFPDGGLGTLTREVGYLLGAPVHYYAYLDLAGFKGVVDAIGGVDIINKKQISDSGYGFPDGKIGFSLPPGPHHLDSRLALAYARSRNGPGDNDFTRARRQQELLIAIKVGLTKPTNLAHLPEILDALAKTVQTDYPADKLPDLLLLAKQIPEDSVTHLVLGPPYARQPAVSMGIYELIIDQARFTALSLRIFGADSTFASPAPSRQP